MTAELSSEAPTTGLGCPVKSTLHERIAARVERGLAHDALAGIRQAAIVRAVALLVVAGWVVVNHPFPQAWFYLAILFILLALGVANRLAAVALFPATWPSYLFILADSCLVAAALAVPNPFGPEPWPIQMHVRHAPISFFYIFIAATLPTYAPRKVLWSGASAILAWSAVLVWVAWLPETDVGMGSQPFIEDTSSTIQGPFTNPYFIYLDMLLRDLFLLAVVTGILAAVVWRVRAMVLRQSETERQRANLARYFSPNMVEELAGADQGFDTVRQHDAAVLFVDMVGFTGFVESHSPEETFAVLREFHGLMAEQIFANDGTLDKYIGDAVMAIFGVPRAGPRDAANALACARAMLAALDAWNERRAAVGERPVKATVGVHCGPVVAGDIGDERRLEFAVIGDTVNVASRLEHLTRELATDAVFSDDLIVAAHRELSDEGGLFDGLTPATPQVIRGRAAELAVWTLAA